MRIAHSCLVNNIITLSASLSTFLYGQAQVVARQAAFLWLDAPSRYGLLFMQRMQHAVAYELHMLSDQV